MEDRRDDDDGGSMAWPGFVDILSAVIIMFVFFVMITAIVMFVMSVEHKEAMESENKKKVQEEIEDLKEKMLLESNLTSEEFELQVQKISEIQNLSEQNKDMNEEILTLSAEVKQLKADLAEAVDQNAVISEDNKTMVVLYKKNEMSLSPAVETMIREFVKANSSDISGQPRVILETGDAPDADSVSLMRELALARTLNVRNVMLTEDMGAAQISVEYTDSEKIEDSYHWVKIRIE